MQRPHFVAAHKFLAAATLTLPLTITSELKAQVQWMPTKKALSSAHKNHNIWEPEFPSAKTTSEILWKQLAPNKESSPNEILWGEFTSEKLLNSQDSSAKQEEDVDSKVEPNTADSTGFRWPNGQLMREADQIYFRTAYARGSMIQIGDTVYPNLGYNGLQSKPGSWINIQLSAIDDSLIVAPSPCDDGNFLDECADGLMINWIRLWADKNFSSELQWTIHSLSGEGAPYEFSNNDIKFGNKDGGTKFGEGQSIGFKISKNFGKTFGVSLGADRLIHLDKTTDLTKHIYIMGTKIIRLSDNIEPPILSISAGLMSDTYNPKLNIGSVRYPKAIRGGNYPSIFSGAFDNYRDEKYASNTAGASSAFVCAERSIFAGQPLATVDQSCLEEVFVGPVGSIGFAPWPWIGTYAIYNGWDLNFGLSFKPFKEIHWTFSFELVSPIAGLNPGTDRHMNFATCPNDNYSFSACRTRLGFFTDLSF